MIGSEAPIFTVPTSVPVPTGRVSSTSLLLPFGELQHTSKTQSIDPPYSTMSGLTKPLAHESPASGVHAADRVTVPVPSLSHHAFVCVFELKGPPKIYLEASVHIY